MASSEYKLTVVNGTSLSLSLSGPAGPAGPAGPVATPLVRSTAPLSSAMRITGTLTDGTDPLVFPDLLYAGIRDGKPFWEDVGGNPELPDYSLEWNEGDQTWFLFYRILELAWYATYNVATPDLIPSDAWVAFSPATGTPVVTKLETAASSLGQIAIVSETDVYACTRLSPVKWTLLSNP